MSMREELREVRGVTPPTPSPEEARRAELKEIRRTHVREPSPYVAPRPERPETVLAPTPAPAPAPAPIPISSYEAKTRVTYPQLFLPSPAPTPALIYQPYQPYKPYEKWRPTREFPFEKLEEMRKKRLAKMPEAIPPTIKFGAYEMKTEYVAIGATLALIIIIVVLLT